MSPRSQENSAFDNLLRDSTPVQSQSQPPQPTPTPPAASGPPPPPPPPPAPPTEVKMEAKMEVKMETDSADGCGVGGPQQMPPGGAAPAAGGQSSVKTETADVKQEPMDESSWDGAGVKCECPA